MIAPIQIQLRPNSNDNAGERIEIASGDFFGHEVGTLHYLPDANEYEVNGRRYVGIDAALHACVAAAYAYVAAERSADAT